MNTEAISHKWGGLGMESTKKCPSRAGHGSQGLGQRQDMMFLLSVIAKAGGSTQLAAGLAACTVLATAPRDPGVSGLRTQLLHSGRRGISQP